ncbi:hypothetical protein BJ742DRAFT_572300 [Cladochytrium replicatum]|nr:hypothetical protein BJ742DRAFT_572300 [Cladochytrium replicatum]
MHAIGLIVLLGLAAQPALGALYTSTALFTNSTTPFGSEIEGAAVDASGKGYAVNYGKKGTQIGRFDVSSPSASLDFTWTDDTSTMFNGVRVVCDDGASNRVYLAADKQNKRVIKVTKTASGSSSVRYCGDNSMLGGVPNDLTFDWNTNRIYLSGQAYPSSGEVWMCRPDGSATKLSDSSTIQGRTNGIEISADGRTLYVSEATSSSTRILAFTIDPSTGGFVSNSRRVFYDFNSGTSTVDVDGMRLDTAGNLFVVKNGGGEVAMISPSGQLLRKITLVLTDAPTNIEFAGTDGKTAIVVGRCPKGVAYQQGNGCVEKFDVENAGLAWTQLNARKSSSCPFLPSATTTSTTTTRPPQSSCPAGVATVTVVATVCMNTATLTSSPRITSTPSPTACSAKFGQCGGQSWNGPKCCEAGSTCTVSNQFYSQCL